jgi:4-hydroxybenzoyl-CoA reductase subunit beta
MHLDPFELHRPETLEDVVRLAHEHEGRFDYLAGGTDLLPNYKMHLNLRPHLIALDRVSALAGHSLDRLGAMARLADLERDPALRSAYPGVADALDEIATPLVRASGTVGGNLLLETRCFFFNQSYFWRQSLGFCLKADGDACHVVPQKRICYATFSGDLAPVLMTLDAEIELIGADGATRRVPVAELYDSDGDGIRRLRTRPGELLVAVHLPPESRHAASAYLKLRVRPTFDFPELGVAATLSEDDDGRVRTLRLAAGGLETHPRRFDELTRPLLGERLTDGRLGALAEAIQRGVRPVHNTFLAPDYRKKMAGVFVRRAIQRARASRRGAPAASLR